jgi:hypothetical protein
MGKETGGWWLRHSGLIGGVCSVATDRPCRTIGLGDCVLRKTQMTLRPPLRPSLLTNESVENPR